MREMERDNGGWKGGRVGGKERERDRWWVEGREAEGRKREGGKEGGKEEGREEGRLLVGVQSISLPKGTRRASG